MTLDLNFVRSQFPALDNEWVFMDNAGGTQILKGCVDKINEYYYSNNVQLGGSYEPSQAASAAARCFSSTSFAGKISSYAGGGAGAAAVPPT